ncbi:MAG: AAA family ATPase [Mesorhizobium sp.]|uniref:AAA family ATPase n=1 Tax=Mesorhizobium sp. TaxID=1871066 RepID=UPI000FE4965F|nr:AAA family ATPase [Mesorhizobium sp.]RWG57986.1 MAG: AAA family ATPase [Mesorhizobium sp.]
MGNGGCGKTWLARRLGTTLGLPVVHLDDMHWEPGHNGIARDRALRDADVQAAAQADTWIMEGVYGQLVNTVLSRVTSLIWIDLPEEECMANIRQRGMQGEESEQQFQDLLNWVAEYRTRTKNWNSFEAHSKLFVGYSGSKSILTSREEISAYVDKVLRYSAVSQKT